MLAIDLDELRDRKLKSASHSCFLQLAASVPGLHTVVCTQKTPPCQHLWKTGGISTGTNVQNRLPNCFSEICPTFLQPRNKLFPALKKHRKPLNLWRKLLLSTNKAAFTITTNLYTNLFTTTTKPITSQKPLRYRHDIGTTSAIREETRIQGQQAGLEQAIAPFAAPAVSPQILAKPSSQHKSAGFSQLNCGKVAVYPQGRIVQNHATQARRKNYPRFVPCAHTVCTAEKLVLKSLILWSKRDLSTEERSFTIYY